MILRVGFAGPTSADFDKETIKINSFAAIDISNLYQFEHSFSTPVVLSSRNLVPGLGDLEGEIPPRAIEFGIIMWLCVLIPSLNINYLLISNGIRMQNHIIMKNNI